MKKEYIFFNALKVAKQLNITEGCRKKKFLRYLFSLMARPLPPPLLNGLAFCGFPQPINLI